MIIKDQMYLENSTQNLHRVLAIAVEEVSTGRAFVIHQITYGNHRIIATEYKKFGEAFELKGQLVG